MAKKSKKEEPAINIFESAEVVVDEKKKKAKRDDKLKISPESDIDLYAILSAVEKTVKSLMTTQGDEIKEEGLENFIRLGRPAEGSNLPGSRPDNFLFTTEDTRVSVELRKRASSSPLSAEEVEALEKLGVDPKKLEEDKHEIPGRYFFNEELMKDQSLMSAISKALSSVPELKDKQIIKYQAPVSNTKILSSEDAIDAAFNLDSPEKTETALSMLTVMSLKPSTTKELDIRESLQFVIDHLPKKEEGE